MMVLHGNSFDAVFSNAARGGFDRSSVSFVYVDLYDAIAWACREVLSWRPRPAARARRAAGRRPASRGCSCHEVLHSHPVGGKWPRHRIV